MGDVHAFGVMVLVAGVAVTAAVLSNRLTERLRVPAPLLFLLVAALCVHLAPGLNALSMAQVQRVVTVALVIILFDGGMHIGLRRFRATAAPILTVGVVGTFLTAGAVAALAHALFGIDWRPALLLGTAVAPTDPAVVFSVLGRREISGRSGVLLEGESGANDPVGIALMASLVGAAGGGWHAAGATAAEFALEMGVGGAVGVAGGLLLLQFMRRVPLPSEGLYPLRTLAGAFTVYGLATVAHGSGFLAVLVAGIVVGDENAPYKGEIARFHSSLASMGEIVAFSVLGLTVDVGGFGAHDAWGLGLPLAALLAFVVRPLLLAPLLAPVGMTRGEKALVAFAGLKGAVPILLGTYLVTAHVAGAQRLYDAVFLVVAFSVLVQGGLLPWLAERLRVPMRAVPLEPWALGLRFRDEPHALRRYRVVAGARADGAALGDLPLDDAWVSFVVRAGSLLRAGADTVLRAGDEVVLVLDEEAADPAPVFRQRG